MHAHNRGKLAVKVNGRTRYVEDPFKNVAPALLVTTILLGIGARVLFAPVEQEAQAAEPASEHVPAQILVQVVGNSSDLEANKKPGQSTSGSLELSIEQIIDNIFGEDAETAKKIAQCESGMRTNAENKWGDPEKPHRGECSIGLFQINLASNNCQGKKVHWAKAQGDTLEEKISWLQVAENNIRVAKQIFDAQGWNAWFNCKNKLGIN